jgi:hypothetical protein
MIDTLNPEYNISLTAGSTAGCKLRDSTKAKIADARRGTKHSAATKAKIAVALQGNKAKYNKGKPMYL